MSSRFGKLLLIALVPLLLYGGFKAVLYYNAKRTMDEMAQDVAGYADLRYGAISTEVLGAVTVHDIEVQPLGSDEVIAVSALRLSSSDPLFFVRGGQWRAGEDPPPDRLAFDVRGIRLPLSAAVLDAAPGAAADPCANGLNFDAPMLRQVGFAEVRIDIDGQYHLDRAERTLEFAINVGMHGVQSTEFAATLANVDPAMFGRGATPDISLARVSMAMRVTPEFGRRAVQACALGSEDTLDAWSERLAERALEQLEMVGLVLGSGLREAMRTFYRDWGEIRLVLAPQQPIAPLALMLLPPEQWADALALRLTINDRPVADTSLRWQQPDEAALAALLGRVAEDEAAAAAAAKAPPRIIVRREYEPVRVADLGRFLDHQVKIKPVGQPVREGQLKRVANGEAEVEQSLHGGKYTVYVALDQIESVEALVQREVGRTP